VWFHAASVGESLSVLPLVERAVGQAEVLVTTGTAASAEVMARRLPAGARHHFAPLDAGGPVERFLDHWRPDLGIFVESEIWPVTLRRSAARGIPLVLMNARLSGGSLRAWGRAPRTARAILRLFERIVAQTEDTRAALVSLGAEPGRVTVGGNMKASAPPPPDDPAERAQLGTILGDAPLWAAISTHPGEEEAVLAAHAVVRERHPAARLILVPRHPARGAEVAELVRRHGFVVTRRSEGGEPVEAVWLADTMGETGLWFRLAPVVFLGGSLVPVGGHNPWEAAQCGAALLIGPLRETVRTDVAALEAAGAARTVAGRRGDGRGSRRPAGGPPAVGQDARGRAGARRGADGPGRRAGAGASGNAAVRVDVRDVEVIAPNLKRRYSGVTSTVLRLVPVQARDIGIAAAGPVLPEGIPRVPLSALPVLPRDRWRVWHARRNVEMLAGLMMRGLLGRRLKLLFTSAAQRRHSAYTRWLLRRMDAVVATSARAAGYLERPATVIRHGIDTDLFHPVEDRAALRRGLGLPEDGLVIGCFGRVRRQKGTDLFVEAMISVLPEHPGAVAVVMGGVTKDQEGFVQGLRTRIAEPGWKSAYGFSPRTGAGASPPGSRPATCMWRRNGGRGSA
jgi:3-deoxy-D-manno-octulosonic-acid transferase